MTYCRRKFLNDPDSPSTGSVVAYDGPGPWLAEDHATFLEIAGCHSKVRLHLTDREAKAQFIGKLFLLRTVIDEFIIHLEGKS